VQRREKGRLGALLVDRSAAHDDLAELRLVDQRALERRRGPLGRIGLLDVEHEVDAVGDRRARVERREDAGLAVGRNLLRATEARLLQHPDQEVAALAPASLLRRDRRLLDPVLEPLDRLVVPLRDLLVDRVEVGRLRPRRSDGGRNAQRRGGGAHTLQKRASIHASSLLCFKPGGDKPAPYSRDS
jgi:hypothetical protein